MSAIVKYYTKEKSKIEGLKEALATIEAMRPEIVDGAEIFNKEQGPSISNHALNMIEGVIQAKLEGAEQCAEFLEDHE